MTRPITKETQEKINKFKQYLGTPEAQRNIEKTQKEIDQTIKQWHKDMKIDPLILLEPMTI